MSEEAESNEWTPPEIRDLKGQKDPYPWFKEMRQKAPLRYDEERDTYDLFRYDVVTEAISDPERFSKTMDTYINGSVMNTEPPLHTELRGMAEEYFTPSHLEGFRPKVEERAEKLLDDCLPEDEGEIQFVEDIAKPLPILVIADLLGVPSDRLDTFREWSRALAEAPESPTPEAKRRDMERKLGVKDDIIEFFTDEIERRERNPADDMITQFVETEKQSDLVERDNIVAQCGMLLIAGNVTTTEFLTNAIWTFCEESVIPEIQSGRISLDNALEEVLRYRSPVMVSKRLAKEDTTLAGVDIHEGARVVGWLNSANRDERIFEHPDEFHPRMEYNREPIPYGHGIHYCLGATLANMEGEILFSKLLERIEDAEIATDDFTPFISTEIFGPVELPIKIKV